MPALFSIVGQKGSPKSEVLAGLVETLSRRGLKVGVIKCLRRDDFEIEDTNTDTFLYRKKGAHRVVLAGRNKMAVFSTLKEQCSLEALRGHFEGFDVVFTQGYSKDSVSSIEVESDFPFENLETLAFAIEQKVLAQKSGV